MEVGSGVVTNIPFPEAKEKIKSVDGRARSKIQNNMFVFEFAMDFNVFIFFHKKDWQLSRLS